MLNKRIFITCLVSILLIACTSESENTPQATQAKKTSNTKQSKTSATNPCDFISIEKVAEALGLDASQITTRSEEFAGTYQCTFLTTEIIADPGDAPEDIAVISVRYNEDGKYRYDQALAYQLEQGEFKVPAGPDKDKMVPLKKINDLGSNAAGHAAAHYATIIFHDDNEVRISVTVYRKIPGNFIFNGIEASEEEALAMLEKIAKTLNYK